VFITVLPLIAYVTRGIFNAKKEDASKQSWYVMETLTVLITQMKHYVSRGQITFFFTETTHLLKTSVIQLISTQFVSIAIGKIN